VNVLLVSHDAGGTIPPMLALAQAFVARGHDVGWMAQPSVERRAMGAGCGFVPFKAAGGADAAVGDLEQLVQGTSGG
jgi:UDP:flavonoid glycosyltransferase YjiC (YdhE family)